MIKIPGYKTIKLIGQGGMASVYLAIQESVGRNVAIKVMSPALSSDPTFSERFVKEARMASLIHPHIVSVFDAGEIDGQNYIIMEYANGGNLDTAIKTGLSLKRIIEIITEIASALHYSATKGFIHRDVKPENILIREDGSAILVDFGIAKAISVGTKLTMVGSTIGSPNYMSPEQARGLPLDGRSDLYSLGIVLFEALTGARPYDADDTFVIGLKHINDPVPILPEEFKAFQPILNKLLAKAPEDRFNNGQELVESLKRIQIENGHPIPSSDNDINNDQTIISPTPFQQQKTVEAPTSDEITQVDDSTRVVRSQNLDKTRVKPQTDDKTVVKPIKKAESLEEHKNKLGLIASFLIVMATVIGGGFWYWQSQPEETIQTDKIKPVIEPTPKIEEPLKETPKEISKLVEPVIEEQSRQDIISQHLKNAAQAMKQKRFTTPDENNAFYYYDKVLSLDENNENALAGIKKLAEEYLSLANKQFKKKAYESSLRFIDKGLYVEPENIPLITLRDKIYTLQQQEKEKQLTFFTDHKTVLKQENNITSIKGKHISDSVNENFWFARQDLINRIYDQILKQCNSSSNAFSHPDCENSYDRFVKQWPLPLVATIFNEKETENGVTGEIKFNKTKINKDYKSLLNHYRLEYKKGIETDFSNKEQLITLANYDLHSSLAPLFGIKINKNINETLQATMESYRHKKAIKHADNLSNIIKKMAMNKKVYIKPFTAKNSYEITPFSQALYHNITETIEISNAENAEHTLLGEYEITPDGNYNLDLWFFDKENKIVGIQALILDSEIVENTRQTPYLYNTTIFPKSKLEKAYGFPTELSIGNQTSNALLQVGDSTDLKVKLDDIGFYFIAVHVKRASEEFSYLLPLHNAEIPFVQVTTRKNANKFITLGSFNITPPTGVEVLQLIASSVNLEKYLPDYDWDATKNQFIIKDSIGNIENGIKAIRDKANTINANSHKNGTSWQEKLLVTSILEK